VAAHVARVKTKFTFIEAESPDEEDFDENMFMEESAYKVAARSMFLNETRWGQLADEGDFSMRALPRCRWMPAPVLQVRRNTRGMVPIR
jgi:hypothetical protein